MTAGGHISIVSHEPSFCGAVGMIFSEK